MTLIPKGKKKHDAIFPEKISLKTTYPSGQTGKKRTVCFILDDTLPLYDIGSLIVLTSVLSVCAGVPADRPPLAGLLPSSVISHLQGRDYLISAIWGGLAWDVCALDCSRSRLDLVACTDAGH